MLERPNVHTLARQSSTERWDSKVIDPESKKSNYQAGTIVWILGLIQQLHRETFETPTVAPSVLLPKSWKPLCNGYKEQIKRGITTFEVIQLNKQPERNAVYDTAMLPDWLEWFLRVSASSRW